MRLLPPILLLVACGTPVNEAPPTAAEASYSSPNTVGTVPSEFLEAFDAEDVPMELLFAISKAETNFQMVVGEQEFPDQDPGYGLMGLRGEYLELAAELIDEDVEIVKTERAANVHAAAALLALWASEEQIDTESISEWAPIVARYSGIEGVEGQREYVHYEVYQALEDGIMLEDFEVVPLKTEPNFPLPERDGHRTGDGSSVWTYSPNHNSRSGDAEYVVIHTCEGSYSGCWSWLSQSASGVSAHYVVNDSGSEVRQLVDEDDRAWHASANYDCDLNDGIDCWRNGTSMNTLGIGIEHAGYGSQSSWNPGLISRSAELVCGITDRHGIPRDANHIIGHGQIQPWNRSDPGPNWPWTDYLAQIGSYCGDSGSAPPSGGGGGGGGSNPPSGGGGSNPPSGGGSSPPTGATGQFVIDSNNGANDTATHYIEVSNDWWASANVSGYYNTGYWVAPTMSVSDPASFWFSSSTTQCFTVEAWWTSGSDRPSSVAFIGWDEGDVEVGRSTVNQRTNGSRWNYLGDWEFPAGWNRVMLSRWTNYGDYAVADAVRMTPSTSCP